MKQRLLLALLALFAAAGMVKAESNSGSSNTLTIPGNSRAVTLTFTKASNSSITVKVGEKPLTESGGKYTINSAKEEQEVTIEGEGISALTVNGPVSNVSLSINSLKTLTLKNGEKLGKGESSNEPLSLNGCSLTTLEVNNCGLDYLPTSGFSATEDVTVSATNNKITSLADISITERSKKLTYKLDKNQIISLPGSSITNVTFDYGTQVITHDFNGDEPIANKWFNVKTSLIGTSNSEGGIPALKALQDKDITISWLYNNSTVTLTKGDNPMDYKFYNGTFLDGAFQCQITPKDTKLPTYIVHMQVAPAEFKFSYSVTPAEKGNTLTINKLDKTDNTFKTYDGSGKLNKTDKLQLSPSAAKGYTFKEYKRVGIEPTSTAGIYDVVGDKDKDEVSLEAIFEQKKYTVTIDASAHGGYEIIDGENNKITGTSHSLPHGTKLYIKVTPDAGYEALVVQDGSVISAITDESHKGEYLCTVEGNTKISITFQPATEDPKLIIPANDKIQWVKINGTQYSDTKSETETKTTTTPPTLGAQEISIKKGATVYVEVTPAEGHNIAQIILNGKVISTNTKANFTMPESDASLTFKVVDATTIGFQISGDANTYTYDGTEKKFNFTTVPAGITGFTVKYSPENMENYTTTLPVAAGTYKVSLYRAADALYKKVENKYDTKENSGNDIYKVIIKQATPTITTLPSVTVDANTQAYKISGGSAQAYGKTIPGKFQVVVAETVDSKTTYKEVSVCTTATNHIALVRFVPTDDANHTNAIAQVPVQREATAAKKYKISWKNIPSDMTFTVKNGDAEIKSGTEVAEGTKLFVQVEFPAGYTAVKIVEDNAKYTVVAGGESGSSKSPLSNTTDYPVTKQVTFTVQYKGKAAEAKTAKVKITAPGSDNPITYNGSVQTVQIGSEENNKYKLEWEDPSDPGESAPTLTITYKDTEGKAVVSPVNAGKYTVCVHIPAFSVTTETSSSPSSALQLRADGEKITTYYKETNVEFKDAFIIEKANITIPAAEGNNNWPTAAYVGVGQKLSQAKMIGGVAPIAGRFAFVDGDTPPENGVEYPIKFIPADNTNYNEVVGSQKATVTVSDKRIIAFDNIVNGTVTVKDKATGKEYKAGDELPSTVKELVITATPNTGYKLESLTVDGSSISNGSTYTLGSKSITINATFYASYKVTVTKPSKGAVVTLPSSSEVKKGESYSFTVACLTADKSKIVVKDGSTVITGTDGKYIISNITADKAISITLDNPTAITVAADTTLSPHKKPMGTVKITGITDDGKCYYGETVTVKATPVSGVQFAGWTGTTETTATFSFKATQPSYKFKAKYTGSPTGIETIEGLRVYGSQGHIFVGCDTEATVTLIHMNGRVKKVQISGDTRIEAQAGIYGVVVEKGSERMQTKVIVR